ncbi:hypothetical protein [Brachybacterium sacelli]
MLLRNSTDGLVVRRDGHGGRSSHGGIAVQRDANWMHGRARLVP